MLRIATPKDLDLIVDMAKKFASSTSFSKHTDETYIKSLVTEFITGDTDNKVCLIYDNIGMLGGVKTPFMFGPVQVATEIAWWVDPEHRKNGVGEALIEAFEYWAKKVGCDLITMVCLEKDLGKYYESRGYKLYEYGYVKEI